MPSSYSQPQQSFTYTNQMNPKLLGIGLLASAFIMWLLNPNFFNQAFPGSPARQPTAERRMPPGINPNQDKGSFFEPDNSEDFGFEE